jgi:AbrB family looped-hinge helix DNA binding protein
MKSVVSDKGQVTIPKGLRDRLGLRPGSTIEFEVKNGKLIGAKRDPAGEDPVQAVTGILKGPRSVDDYLDDIRGAA